MKNKFLVLLLVSLSSLSLNCGYSARSLLPSSLRTVHVEAFKNNILYTEEQKRDIYIPLLEVRVRNAIIDRFLFDGSLKTADPALADLTLSGELKGYERNVLRSDEDQNVQEYRIHIIISLVLKDNHKKLVRWEEPEFVGETTYFVTGPHAKTEAAAIEDALKDLGRRVVERTIEDW